jgi:menaquinone-9 beta-reductase
LKDVVIIGGGIAGLISSIILSRQGISCTLVEKKNYPLHRVCGEYVSNEAVPFLELMDLYPSQLNPPRVSRFQLSSVSGKNKILPLDLGGFGISRFSFDHFLFAKARESGVTFLLDTTAENVEFSGQSFIITAANRQIESKVVLGAFGKRSNIDSRLERGFMKKRSPYVGVKYHIEFDHPSDVVALHNFPGGYCGLSGVENGVVNMCYLVHRSKLKEFRSIPEMEEKVLTTNPFLREVFHSARFLMEKPEVINEISFETKEPVENHILMIGDAAGLITPLCGNGIAMAIHSAKIATAHVARFLNSTESSRIKFESEYALEWTRTFGRRLQVGRQIQKLFGSATGSNAAVNIALYLKPVAMKMIRNTHGKAF